MKKLTILFSLIVSVAFGQTSFRTITLAGSAQKVNVGFTLPQVVNVVNDTATILFVKFYDKATQPFSTDAPSLTIMVPATSSTTINLRNGIKFTKGLWIRAGKGETDADTTYNKYKAIIPIVEITY